MGHGFLTQQVGGGAHYQCKGASKKRQKLFLECVVNTQV